MLQKQDLLVLLTKCSTECDKQIGNKCNIYALGDERLYIFIFNSV